MTSNVKLEVCDLNSPDVEIRSWQPTSLESVKFLLEFEIGETGDKRKDLFQVVVATPEALRKTATGPIIADRANLIIAEYSYSGLCDTINQIVEQCAAPTWEESVLRLQRYFRWEYEDYSSD